MALFGVGAENDPRTQPLAYITDGTRLCEVMKQLPGAILVEDCKTAQQFQVAYSAIQGTPHTMTTSGRRTWVLVQAAPSEAPETADL